MNYRVTYDMCEEELPDADAAGEFLDERSMAIAPHGGRANAYWFAPAGADDVLRLDIDYGSGRAALRWLPDGTHAVELDPAGPIVVLESSDYDVVTIPAELARVSVKTAYRAIAEYVTTGQRPTCVEWTKPGS
jgi:Immunity protein Imm1